MRKLMIYIMILLTLPTNVQKDTFSIGKSEFFKIEEVGENHIVNEEDLEKILKLIYEEFRKEDMEIFPEGLQFDIMSKVEGNRMGYSNFSTISYYAMDKYEWEDKPLYFTTMHEMGHMFKYRYLTKEDFKRYLELRNITFERFLEKLEENTKKYPHLTEENIMYLLDTQETLAEDFRMFFSEEKFNTRNSQFLWGNLTKKEKKEIKEFLIEILKRERTEEKAIEMITYNSTNHYGMFGN